MINETIQSSETTAQSCYVNILFIMVLPEQWSHFYTIISKKTARHPTRKGSKNRWCAATSKIWLNNINRTATMIYLPELQIKFEITLTKNIKNII